MTKRIISMLLVLTMVLSIAVMSVSAASEWGGMTDTVAPSLEAGSTTTFIIDTPQKLAWLSVMVENAAAATEFLQGLDPEAPVQQSRKVFADYTFKQTADIDLGGAEFMPIGSYMGTTRHLFGGIYDGNGYKIMNAKVSMYDHVGKSYYTNEVGQYTPAAAGGNGHYDALFNISASAAVKNVNAVNVHTGNYDAKHTGTLTAGVICGFGIEANIIGCTTDSTSSATSAGVAGGMLACLYGKNTFTIANCTNAATITGDNAAGGIMGFADYVDKGVYVDLRITNCTNNGTVTSTAKECGGILGKAGQAAAVITGCVNNGAVSSGAANYSGRVGGIVGSANTMAVYKFISNCTNNGTITGKIVGGIAGRYDNGDIYACVNYGTVIADQDVADTNECAGGIVADMNQVAGTIEGCVNNGEINSVTQAGGIAAFVYPNSVISTCTNNGAVTGARSSAGIVAQLSVATITMCVNNGEITANMVGSSYRWLGVGGIVGYVELGSTTDNRLQISYCVNTATLNYNLADVASSNYRASIGGIVGNTMAKGSSGASAVVYANYSYCFNTASTFNAHFTGTGTANYLAASGGIEGYSTDATVAGASTTANPSRIYNNCYSVAGIVNEYRQSETPTAIKWEWAQNAQTINGNRVWYGLLPGCMTIVQVCEGLTCGTAIAINNFFGTSKYGASVEEIEAMSVYKEIISATPADAAADIKFIGVQDSLIKGETYDVRFVAGIDSLDFEAAGFMVKISSAAGTMAEAAKIADTTVYTSLVGKKDDETIVYNAADYGTTYFVALSIEGINLATYGAITFEITPFTTVNGVDVEGHTYVVSYDGDGNFVSCARQGA